MTSASAAAGQPSDDDPTARIFHALIPGIRPLRDQRHLRCRAEGTRWFAGHSLGDIARQISDQDHPGPAASPTGPGQIVAATSSAESSAAP
jgi:hypothetical protein